VKEVGGQKKGEEEGMRKKNTEREKRKVSHELQGVAKNSGKVHKILNKKAKVGREHRPKGKGGPASKKISITSHMTRRDPKQAVGHGSSHSKKRAKAFGKKRYPMGQGAGDSAWLGGSFIGGKIRPRVQRKRNSKIKTVCQGGK